MMETSCYATDPLLEEAPEVRSGPGIRVLLAALFVVTGLAAAVLTGAVLLHIAGPSLGVMTSPAFPGVLAGVAAVVVALAIPLGLDAAFGRPARRADPLRHAAPRGLVAVIWNTAVVLALVALCPGVTRAALALHGDWMAASMGTGIQNSVRDGARWLSAQLPTGTPVALTHGTGEGMLDTVAVPVAPVTAVGGGPRQASSQ